jgi:hypothetical protein
MYFHALSRLNPDSKALGKYHPEIQVTGKGFQTERIVYWLGDSAWGERENRKSKPLGFLSIYLLINQLVKIKLSDHFIRFPVIELTLFL